jgi:hypothetical protein
VGEPEPDADHAQSRVLWCGERKDLRASADVWARLTSPPRATPTSSRNTIRRAICGAP